MNTKSSRPTPPGCRNGAHRQEHLRLARAAQPASMAATSTASTRSPTKNSQLLAHRGINSLWLIGVWERSRASKTIKQLCGNQRRRRLRLLALRLQHCRRPRRRAGLHQSSRPRLPSRHSPRQRHGAQPHGHRLALGHRASRLVHLPPGHALSRLQLQRSRPLARRPRRNQNRRPLLRTDRRRRRLPPPRQMPAAKPATSITATTAPASPGTTPRSSTTSTPTSASRSSRPSFTSRASSRSSASTPP